MQDVAIEAEPGRFRSVTCERTRPVGEPEPGTCRHGRHVRAIEPAVGHESHLAVAARCGVMAGSRKVACQRQVSVRHRHHVETRRGEASDSLDHGTRKAEVGREEHERAVLAGERRNFGVVTDDRVG